FACPRISCQRRFKTSDEALRHAEDPSHAPGPKYYACPSPNCHMTAVGRGMSRPELKEHWKVHVRRGHVSSKAKLEYNPMEAIVVRRLSLYDRIHQYAGESLLNMDDEDTNISGIEELYLDEDLETQDLDLTNEADLKSLEIDNEKLFTEGHRSIVMSQNAEYIWHACLATFLISTKGTCVLVLLVDITTRICLMGFNRNILPHWIKDRRIRAC
ncbi:uncharacterized protein BKA55DRAFT_711054, partial [Fusarium redolens]